MVEGFLDVFTLNHLLHTAILRNTSVDPPATSRLHLASGVVEGVTEVRLLERQLRQALELFDRFTQVHSHASRTRLGLRRVKVGNLSPFFLFSLIGFFAGRHHFFAVDMLNSECYKVAKASPSVVSLFRDDISVFVGEVHTSLAGQVLLFYRRACW